MQIVFQATVVSAPGEVAGKVATVLIDPTTGLLSHLVASLPSGEDPRAVPVWAVERADGYEVFLKADAPEIEQLPVFRPGRRATNADEARTEPLAHEPGDFPALYPENGSLPNGAVAVGEHTRLLCDSEVVSGQLVGVEVDDYTAEATILYVRLQGDGEKTVAVPMAWAGSVSGRQIKLQCARTDLEGLPDSPISAPESPIEPLQRG